MLHSLLFAATLLAPPSPVAPIVKGTALSVTDAERAAILAPAEAIFAALATGDGAAVLQQVHGSGGITVSVDKPDGTRVMRQQNWAEWAAAFKSGAAKYEERFVGTPRIEIDGDIAMVWGEYVFLIDGKLSHCGVDHFSLLRVDGQWKITSLTWTQRKTGCPTL